MAPRRVGALRKTGLVRIAKAKVRGTPYEATDWLRRAVAPLLTAADLERRGSSASALDATEMWAVAGDLPPNEADAVE